MTTNCESHHHIDSRLATRMALDTDGTTKIAVCDSCSYSTRFWGSWPIEAPAATEAISEFEVMEALPTHTDRITFRIWLSTDGTQRISFPTHTNMILISTALCSRGYFTEPTKTSRYCLKIQRLSTPFA